MVIEVVGGQAGAQIATGCVRLCTRVSDGEETRHKGSIVARLVDCRMLGGQREEVVQRCDVCWEGWGRSFAGREQRKGQLRGRVRERRTSGNYNSPEVVASGTDITSRVWAGCICSAAVTALPASQPARD